MRDLAMRALDTAKSRGADYADVRIVRFKSENITVRNKNVEALTADESLGFGVRVIVDGFWGFAASHKMTLDEASAVAAEAVRVAKASGLVRGPRADIGPPQSVSGTYRTKEELEQYLKRDPIVLHRQRMESGVLRCGDQ